MRSVAKRYCEYLRVFETELFGELLAVGFADILLFLEDFLESFALEVGEDGTTEHASTRFASHSGPEQRQSTVQSEHCLTCRTCKC